MEDKVSITYVPTITLQDIEKLCGSHWTECAFAGEIPNDSYAIIYLDEDALLANEEDLEWALEKGDDYAIKRYENQKCLINALRELGLTEKILVEVCW